MSKDRKAKDGSEYTRYIPVVDRNYNLVMLLGLTMSSLMSAWTRQLKDSGLTPAEFHLLILVDKLGEQAIPAELARLLLRKPPAITMLLNRMEKSGLVKRKSLPNNRKTTRVVMTRKGQEAFRIASRSDIFVDVIGGMSLVDFQDLWALLERLKDRAVEAASEA